MAVDSNSGQAFDPLTGQELARLVAIVDRLLGPGGCPWDQEQTHETLKRHLLEEAYEVLEAIDSGDPDKLCEELGDLLLQPIMHAQMEARDGRFASKDVASSICDKLIRRHPHVFGPLKVEDADEVLRNWDRIKQEEKAGEPKSILEGVPKSLPALHRAFEVSKRAARVGFEWPDLDAVFAKLDEEIAELKAAIRQTASPLEGEAPSEPEERAAERSETVERAFIPNLEGEAPSEPVVSRSDGASSRNWEGGHSASPLVGGAGERSDLGERLHSASPLEGEAGEPSEPGERSHSASPLVGEAGKHSEPGEGASTGALPEAPDPQNLHPQPPPPIAPSSRQGEGADAIADEVGDLLFTSVNIARWTGVEPEEALRKMVLRFETRFRAMEAAAPRPLRDLSAEEWDDLWNRAKATEVSGAEGPSGDAA